MGKRTRLFGVIGALCVFGLLSMHHTTSWGVFLGLLGLLVLHSAGRNQIPVFIIMLLIAFSGYLIVGDTITERLTVALQTDIAVIEGEKDSKYAFHGRMSRWTHHVEDWEKASIESKLLGVSLAPPTTWWSGMLTGVHNDYLRIMFCSGLLGLILYLLFNLSLVLKSFNKTSSADKFLIRSAVAVMLVYSITTVPTLYPPFLYLFLSIYAYGALPNLNEKYQLTPEHYSKRNQGRSRIDAFPNPYHPSRPGLMPRSPERH